MRKILFHIISVLFFISCDTNENQNQFSGKFQGFWADTFWQYDFYSNGTFKFKCEGHYDFTEKKGIFEKRGDSIFILTIDSILIKDRVVNSLYLIDGDSCIIDTYLNYDYCKTRTFSKKRNIYISALTSFFT